MNIPPLPFPLRLADPRRLPADAGTPSWVPAVKGYSSLPPETFAPAATPRSGSGPSRAVTAASTRGLPTQFGKVTDPPQGDMSSLDLLG